MLNLNLRLKYFHTGQVKFPKDFISGPLFLCLTKTQRLFKLSFKWDQVVFKYGIKVKKSIWNAPLVYMISNLKAISSATFH